MKLSKDEFINTTSLKAKNIGIELNENQLEKLFMYKEMLVSWNEKINLTAITDDEEIIVKHIIDSLEAIKYIKDGESIIDVGTGAGLPGVIIAIYFDGKVKVTLFDALNKRILFLNDVITKLNLSNTYAVHGRAEEAGRDVKFREKFDVVVSRAVAVLNVLLEITSPFVKVGGKCIYMKAEKTEDEIKLAQNAVSKLALKYVDTHKYSVSLNDEVFNHTIIEYVKNSSISNTYPRQFAKIKKSPL